MCFNKEVSIIVFIFGTSVAIQMLREGISNKDNRKKVVGILIFLVALMQLNEYFLWLYSNKENNSLKPTDPETIDKNYIANIFVIFILFFQVLLTWLACVNYKIINFKNNNSMSFFLSIASAIAILIVIVSFSIGIDKILKGPKTDNLSYKDDKTCRLTWGPITSIYNDDPALFNTMLASYLICFLIIGIFLGKKFIAVIIVILIISLVYSAIMAGNPDPEKKGSDGAYITMFGSMWCFLCIALSIFLGIFKEV